MCWTGARPLSAPQEEVGLTAEQQQVSLCLQRTMYIGAMGLQFPFPVTFFGPASWVLLHSAAGLRRGVSSTPPSMNRPQRAVLSGEIWRERNTKGNQQLRAAKSPGMALGGLSLHPAVQHQPGQGDPCSSYFGRSEPQRACSWVHGAPFILLCLVINTAGGLPQD